jgi:hypothetical protein
MGRPIPFAVVIGCPFPSLNTLPPFLGRECNPAKIACKRRKSDAENPVPPLPLTGL